MQVRAAAQFAAPVARPRRRFHVFNDGKPTAPAASSRRPSAPTSRQPVHPSVLLDAACATCCVVLLTTSAARRLSTSRDHGVAIGPGTTVAPAARGTEAGAAREVFASPAPPAHPPGLATEAVAACTLLTAVGNMVFKLAMSGGPAAARPDASVESAARLARLEALTDKQLAEFGAAVRQIDKLQVRTRVSSGDIRKPIAQLQSASADQSAVLARLASEQEALRCQLRDTQQLLGALQGLTAKQFQVTVDAIKQLRTRQSANG